MQVQTLQIHLVTKHLVLIPATVAAKSVPSIVTFNPLPEKHKKKREKEKKLEITQND
jgi:hypothetical protein